MNGIVQPPAPLVSVVIPLYNSAATILSALKSVLQTGYRPIEIIVVDDNSSDGGGDRVLGFSRLHPEMPIQLLRHADGGNHGPGATRNRGVERASGELVAFLDADDQYLPHRFTASVELLRSNPRLGAVYGPFQYAFPEGQPLEKVRDVTPEHLTPQRLASHPENDLDALRALLRGALGLHTSTVTMRRAVFLQLGGFPLIAFGEDQGLWLRLFATHSVKRADDQPVSIYNVHPRSWCSTRQASAEFSFGPVLARITAIRWLRGQPNRFPMAVRLVQESLAGRLLHRYAAVRDSGRAAHVSMLRIMIMALWSAPQLCWSRRYWSVLTRLLMALITAARTSSVLDGSR